MYNEELKKSFIMERKEEAALPNNYLERHFEKVSKMEEELEKDLCNFSAYEIIEYYKMLNVPVIESLQVLNSQFSIYVQWCLQRNLVRDSQNHFLEVKIEHLDGCVNKAILKNKILTQDTIYQMLNELKNPKDQFIILGLFEGIRGDEYCELRKLRAEDVREGVAYLCTGREIKISKKLQHIIEECVGEDTYYAISGNGERKFLMIDKGYVIKDFPNVTVDSEYAAGRNIYIHIRRILDFLGMSKYISANDIYTSGKLYNIKTIAQKHGMTCREFLYSREHAKIIEDMYECKIIPVQLMRKFKDYLD